MLDFQYKNNVKKLYRKLINDFFKEYPATLKCLNILEHNGLYNLNILCYNAYLGLPNIPIWPRPTIDPCLSLPHGFFL